MSKYLWKNTDIVDIIESSGASSNTTITNKFENFPDVSLSEFNYATYSNNDSDSECPPFFINDPPENLFKSNISSSKKIMVHKKEYTNSSTSIDVPDWATGVKIYIQTTKGNNGDDYVIADGYNINDYSENHTHHNNNENNIGGDHNNNHNYDNINQTASNYQGYNVNGGSGGSGIKYNINKIIPIDNNFTYDIDINDDSVSLTMNNSLDDINFNISVNSGTDGTNANTGEMHQLHVDFANNTDVRDIFTNRELDDGIHYLPFHENTTNFNNNFNNFNNNEKKNFVDEENLHNNLYTRNNFEVLTQNGHTFTNTTKGMLWGHNNNEGNINYNLHLHIKYGWKNTPTAGTSGSSGGVHVHDNLNNYNSYSNTEEHDNILQNKIEIYFFKTN